MAQQHSQRLRDGGVVYGVMAAEFFTPGFCQIARNAGAEFIIFDMEHGGVGMDALKAQMAFARGDRHRADRAGSRQLHIILLRRSSTPAPWALWRRWSRLESRPKIWRVVPISSRRHTRSGLRRRSRRLSRRRRHREDASGERAHDRDRSRGNRQGDRNADGILGVPGIDVGWLGHYDLTDTMGMTAEFDRAEFNAAVAKLFGACEGTERRPVFSRRPSRRRGSGAPRGSAACATARTLAFFSLLCPRRCRH